MRVKLSALLLLLSMSVAAFGQGINIAAEPLGSGAARYDRQQYIGQSDDRVLLLQHDGKSRVPQQLCLLDFGQNLLAQADLGQEEGGVCYGGFINGAYVDLLMAISDGGSLRVWRDRRSLLTLQPAAPQADIVHRRLLNGERHSLLVAAAQSQQHVALADIAFGTALQAEVRISLLGRDFEEQWQVPLSAKRVDGLFVSDSGVVVLWGIEGGKNLGFALVQQGRFVHYSAELPAVAADLQVVNYLDGCLLLSSMSTEGGKVNIFSYDVRTQELSSHVYTLTREERNRLMNRDDNRHLKRTHLKHCGIAQTIADGDGGYVVLDRTWGRSFDDVPAERQRSGWVVLKVSKQGTVGWVKSGRLLLRAPYEEAQLLGHRWLPTPEGIMLAYTVATAATDLPATEAIPQLTPRKQAAALTVVHLAHDGAMQMRSFKIGKQALIGAAHPTQHAGEYLMLLSDGDKGQFLHLNVD